MNFMLVGVVEDEQHIKTMPVAHGSMYDSLHEGGVEHGHRVQGLEKSISLTPARHHDALALALAVGVGGSTE